MDKPLPEDSRGKRLEQSEIGPLPENWGLATIGELFRFSSGKSRPSDTSAAKSNGKPYPVFGGNGVMGFASQYLLEHATLVIGRVGVYCGCAHHTDGAAWISDNALYAKCVDERVDTRYAQNYFEFANLNRYSSRAAQPLITQGILSGIKMPLPPKEEQKKITAVLSAVQRAIERQERLIALTAELKKALMHKLFTEGTRAEPQKQTEIGPVPRSWKVAPLAGFFSREPSNGLYRPKSDYGRGTLILRIDDFSNDGDIVTTASNRVDVGEVDCQRFGLMKDDIVLNRVNSLSHLGKTALIADLDEPMLFESNMMRFRVDETRLRPAFAFRVLNSAVCKAQIIGMAKRAVAQSSVNQGDVGRLLIPLPPDIVAQDEIVSTLNAVETKSAVHGRTRASLDSLFRTLLHQLMTAQIRVHDLDLSTLEKVG